jgi:sugar phosphate isomerase/epimerase
MTMQYTLHQGTQMYSFAYELRAFQYSPEDVLQWCGQLGVGGHYFGLGVPQNRGAFEATNEFVRFLKSASARFGVVGSMYGSYLDESSHPTDDEKFEFQLMQLKSARKLGFPLMRTWWAGPGYMDKLLPYAEKYKIKLAYEIHTPMALGRGDPTTDQCIEYVLKKSSEYLGILPDGGSFSTKIPIVGLNYAKDFLRISPAIIQQVKRWYDEDVPKSEKA